MNNGLFGLPPQTPQQPLYGAPAPRDPLVAALMSQIGNNAPQIQSGGGFMSGFNPMALKGLMNKQPQTGVNPYTYGLTATPASPNGGGLIDSAGNYIP